MPESAVAGALLYVGALSRTVVARIGAAGTAGLLVLLAGTDVLDHQQWAAKAAGRNTSRISRPG